MRASALYRYPVKSLGGESVDSLIPRERGFEDDRRWMLVDGEGRFISQRAHSGLARFRARTVRDQGLEIMSATDERLLWRSDRARPSAPPDLEVTVWDDTFQAKAVPDSGELGDLLGLPGARLVYMNEQVHRPVDERYARDREEVSFADGYPYLIAGQASVEDLNTRCGREVGVLRFRPNIVIEGSEAFAEDQWKEITVGDHGFYLPKPCARCIMITHEPGSGERDLSVLSTLAGYRRVAGKVLFGMNGLWTGGSGALSVGAPVTLLA